MKHPIHTSLTPITLSLGSLLATGRPGEAQACWNETAVSTGPASAVFSADIDGDGDADILTGAEAQDEVAWHENLAGDGSTWTKRIISSSADGVRTVHAADLDGDGDFDVLSASTQDDTIAWYENTAGDGSAWIERAISTTSTMARTACAADVDGDGDLDVVSSCFGSGSFTSSDGRVAWHENVTGDGTSWVEHVIPATEWAAFATAGDIDRDGDIDVFASVPASPLSGYQLVWYENTASTGLSWVEHAVGGIDAAYEQGELADMDVDGDMDFLAYSGYGGEWTENTAGPLHVHGITPNYGPFAVADLDSDGDNDVIAAGFPGLAWVENVDAMGSSWGERPISSNRSDAVCLADLDRDGDLDPIAASATSGVSWYANAPRPSATYRNAGSNPSSYAAVPPLLGGTFTATVDLTTTGHTYAKLIGFRRPGEITLAGGQVLLVDPTSPGGVLPLVPGPLAVFHVAVPSDPGLCGLRLSTQAVHLGGVTPFALSNAQDLVVGVP